jgi:hypothetical protein
MRLTFSYTNTPDLMAIPKSASAIFNMHFDVPDEALQLEGIRERVLTIVELVSKFTQVCLHFSCPELEIKNLPIKTISEAKPGHTLYHEHRPLMIVFKQGNAINNQTRQLKIMMPVRSVFPERAYVFSDKQSLAHSLTRLDYKCANDTEKQYSQYLNDLVRHLLALLVADPAHPDQHGWRCEGFHPAWRDPHSISREKHRAKRVTAEARKRQKEDERRKAREAKLAEKAAQLAEKGILPAEPPKTGAGRRVGAVPGIFKGIQFRSQLEIRFATELEARGVNWVYESERLGDGSYLVDFYLPDYGAWVEVKGKFEPRDDFLLKDVATYLKKERGQRLFVYTSGKPRLVNPSGYRMLERADFWTLLLK